MKKFFVSLIAALAAMVSFAASAAKAPDGVTAFNDSASCLSAVASGKALAYVPATSRAPGSAYAQMSLAEAGYASGACVQGLTTFTSGAWVYLPPTFQVGRNGEHLVMWQCGNAITSIASVPAKQQVTFARPITSFAAAPAACSDTAERCALVEWCNTNDGWKVIEGVRTCEVPGRRDRIIKRDTLDIEQQLVVNPRVLPTQVNAWQGNGDFTVPSAPQARGIIQAPQGPLIDIRRATPPTVQGQQCCGVQPQRPQAQVPMQPQAASGPCGPIPCRPEQVGRLTKIEPSPDGVCRIAATTNNKDVTHFVAFQAYDNGDLAAFQQQWNGNAYVQVGQKMRFPGVRMTDCREIIRTVSEGRTPQGRSIWDIVRRNTGLPDMCLPVGSGIATQSWQQASNK